MCQDKKQDPRGRCQGIRQMDNTKQGLSEPCPQRHT